MNGWILFLCQQIVSYAQFSIAGMYISLRYKLHNNRWFLGGLSMWYRVSGVYLKCFKFDLCGTHQRGNRGNNLYSYRHGSVVGPLLVTLFTTRLGSVSTSHHLSYHIYADDTHKYIALSRYSLQQHNNLSWWFFTGWMEVS